MKRIVKYASCNVFNDNIFNVTENRAFKRPLSGGMAIGNFLNMYGTLGGLFYDDTDGTIVGLTCRHVCDQMKPMEVRGYPGTTIDYLRVRFIAMEDIYNDRYLLYNILPYLSSYSDNYNNEFANIAYRPPGFNGSTLPTTFNRPLQTREEKIIDRPMYQPGYPLFETTVYRNFQQGISRPSNTLVNPLTSRPFLYTIGHIKRLQPLYINPDNINEIDSAVIAIERPTNNQNMLDLTSNRYIGFNYKGPFLFASTDEINSLSANKNTPLFKTGAGTGSTGIAGTLTSSCHTLSFSHFYQDTTAIFVENVFYTNGIAFNIYNGNTNTADNIPLSTLEGDSGSMLWALLSSNVPSASAWKIIGQVFAYSNNISPIQGYASRIDKIQKALNITPWNGQSIKYTPRYPKYFTVFPAQGVEVFNKYRACYRIGVIDDKNISYPANYVQPASQPIQ